MIIRYRPKYLYTTKWLERRLGRIVADNICDHFDVIEGMHYSDGNYFLDRQADVVNYEIIIETYNEYDNSLKYKEVIMLPNSYWFYYDSEFEEKMINIIEGNEILRQVDRITFDEYIIEEIIR